MVSLSSLTRLLPSLCVFCRLHAAPDGICSGCRQDLPRLGFGCARCAEPLPGAAGEGLVCAGCQIQPPPWATCQAVLPYEWPVDVALQRLKYSRQLVFAAALGTLLAREACADLAGVDALCPVPLHRWRHLRRGFNQAEELGKPLQRLSGLPVMQNLRRVRNTTPQSGLGRDARRHNLRGAFQVRGDCRYRHPLLLDDIMTTGETCRQLAQQLLRHGAEQVSVLIVARAATTGQAGVTLKV